MSWSGLSERSGFRARAGTLTLLFLASAEDPATLREMLAQLEAAMYDPDFDAEEDEWEDEDGKDLEGPEQGYEPEDAGLDPDAQLGLGPGGTELLFVARTLEAWLRRSPTGPLRLGEEEAGLALAALVVGWASTVVHALSGAALTFEDLAEATGAVREDALRSRLEALEDTGLVEPLEDAGGETRYAATRWLREGIAPLAAAARHERRQQNEETAPPDVLDVGAAFLLTLPMLELPVDVTGECSLGVRLPDEDHILTGAHAQVENGRVVFIDLDLHPTPENWATGTPIGWLDSLIDPAARKLHFGGDRRLATALVDGLHDVLFRDIL